MPWWSGILFLAILCLNNGVTRSESWPPNDLKENQGRASKDQPAASSNIDIQFDNDPIEMIDASGNGGFPSDDEDFGMSGSGSGSGFGGMDEEEDKMTSKSTTTTTTTTTTQSTTTRPLTDCEIDQRRNQMLQKQGPECLKDGSYSPMQCMNLPGVADCWCVDMTNREIHGTRMEAPNIPSCEDGENLSPCVFELVKAHRPYRLGVFKPRCDTDGQYERMQCRGSICYCVNEFTGRKVKGTEVSKPERPDCDDQSETVLPVDGDDKKDTEDELDTSDIRVDDDEEEAVTLKPYYGELPKKSQGKDKDSKDPQIVFPDGPDGENVNIDSEGEKDNMDTKESEEDNKTGPEDQPEIAKQGDADEKNSVQTAGEIMTQPGILAGIIGGAVVLLLCLVLLIMFIVYRMRKKDEGSYPLDEPRRPANYAYVRAPDREFYA